MLQSARVDADVSTGEYHLSLLTGCKREEGGGIFLLSFGRFIVDASCLNHAVGEPGRRVFATAGGARGGI